MTMYYLRFFLQMDDDRRKCIGCMKETQSILFSKRNILLNFTTGINLLLKGLQKCAVSMLLRGSGGLHGSVVFLQTMFSHVTFTA